MPNILEIFKIVDYFINKEKKLQTLLLIFIEIERAHMGEQLAAHIFMIYD